MKFGMFPKIRLEFFCMPSVGIMNISLTKMRIKTEIGVKLLNIKNDFDVFF